MRKFKCSICGYVYDEAAGIPDKGIAPGTRWEDLSGDFVCPLCGAPKSMFKLLGEIGTAPVPDNESVHRESLKELSAGEISAICSNLARGCEKQRLQVEMEAFLSIADYFKAKALPTEDKTFKGAANMLEDDMTKGFVTANAAAKTDSDRGALRSLVWSEKVSAMTKALLDRFAKEGEAMFVNTRIFVCDICGFIYVGNTPPDICPVCKVPNYKIIEVERR